MSPPRPAPPRLALLGDPELEPSFPSPARWPGSRFIPAGPAELERAVAAARAFDPEVLVVADPEEAAPDALRALPGVKVGWVRRPLQPGRGVAALAALTAAGAVDGYAWFEPPPPEASGLPFVRVLPGAVDGDRFPPPAAEPRRVLVPAWARPPRSCLRRIEALAPVEELPLDGGPRSWPAALAGAGALVHWSRAALGRLDPLPLFALAAGLLLVARTPFPAPWGVERDDEYLVAEDEDGVVEAMARALQFPDAARAVRARAWQKAREAFGAEGVFQRLAHDALLLAPARRAP